MKRRTRFRERDIDEIGSEIDEMRRLFRRNGLSQGQAKLFKLREMWGIFIAAVSLDQYQALRSSG